MLSDDLSHANKLQKLPMIYKLRPIYGVDLLLQVQNSTNAFVTWANHNQIYLLQCTNYS